MRVIYADILLTINLAVDYLVLFGTARLAGAKFIRIKGLLAAGIGAIYSFIILFDFSKGAFFITKLTVSAIMIFIAFGKRKTSEFLRLLIIFYICGFLFSGFMMLINSAAHADSFFVKGGIVYFEFSAIGIVLSGTAAFLVTELFRRLFRKGEPEGRFIAKIFYNKKVLVLKGFTDTGNSLFEPISGAPVAVAPKDSIAKIIPVDVIDLAVGGNLSTEYKFLFVPCKTVSGTVLIPAFRPEKLILENEKGEFEAEDIMIAISEFVPENTLILGENLILKENNKIFSEV